MAYIEFKDVIKAYGEGDARIHALDGASFTVERGELAIILGASGAGKTTALNILGGMDTATSGTVTVDGRDVSSANETQLVEYRRADVGFVFQFYNLVPNLTALENVELAAQICPDSLDAEQTLCQVGLGERLANAWAFGDNINDIPMLQAAGHGMAMINAESEDREAADAITEYDNDHDGVARTIMAALA